MPLQSFAPSTKRGSADIGSHPKFNPLSLCRIVFRDTYPYEQGEGERCSPCSGSSNEAHAFN